MSQILDADLAWDWEYQKSDVEAEWFRSDNPEIYFARKQMWHSTLQAMRGVKYGNLLWLHHYEGYGILEMATSFQMTEVEVVSRMNEAAKVIRKRKFYRLGGIPYASDDA